MRTGQGGSAADPIGVVSAVIVDGARPERLLLGVRRPAPLADRHPGVLSTPTLRLPSDLFAVLTGPYADPEPAGMAAVGGPALDVGRGGHIRSAHSFVLEALFARKLGLADAIFHGGFHAVAHPRLLSLEDVPDPLGTRRSQWTAMLTYEVRVRHGAEAIPPASGSYSRLVWVDAAKLPTALDHHDALLLDETLDAIEVCIQGLCVRAAVRLLAGSGAAAQGDR
jgi:hypothetical protein